jgi:hypothetical protein
MGELAITNNIGQYDIALTIDGKKYSVPMGGGKINVTLSPGSHGFSVERNQSWSFHCGLANNCTVQINVGQTTQLSIDRSNYGN